MGQLLNVRRDVDDPFYRYKMERLETKIEGKGNGIKTVVTNLGSVAQALSRPGSYIIKFFGFELGAQTRDDRWIINGAHDSSKLQDHLDGFINKFVLCKFCKNPETVVEVTDVGSVLKIMLRCKACGRASEVDLRLKLSGFILKNQPKKGSKKDKAERKAARKAKLQKDADGNGNGDEGSEQGSDQKAEKSDEAASDDELKKVEAETSDIHIVDTETHEWTVDTSAEAVKARQESLSVDLKQRLTLDDEDDEGEGGGSTVYDELGSWIQNASEEKGGIDNVNSIDIYVKAKALGVENKSRTLIVLVQTIFDEKICAQIAKRASMLKKIITSERHQKALLGGTERFIACHLKDNPDILSQIVKILQLYYNLDLLSEEVATKWGTKASRRYVDLAVSKKIRKAAEPFMTWLAEADEEESDEE